MADSLDRLNRLAGGSGRSAGLYRLMEGSRSVLYSFRRNTHANPHKHWVFDINSISCTVFSVFFPNFLQDIFLFFYFTKTF